MCKEPFCSMLSLNLEAVWSFGWGVRGREACRGDLDSGIARHQFNLSATEFVGLSIGNMPSDTSTRLRRCVGIGTQAAEAIKSMN